MDMNQRAYFSLDKEIESRSYRLYLPVGACWTEAVEITRQFYVAVQEIACAAEKKSLQEQQAAQPQEQPLEEIIAEVQDQGENNGSQE